MDKENNSIQIPLANNLLLEGNLSLPASAQGLVLFAHGSGSSRHSPRNQFVARVLQEAGLATLLIDLLSADEEAADRQTAHIRFNIELLGERVVEVINWLVANRATAGLKLGLFGASTGAAAALVAAAERPLVVGAVVSRGGRPDLASSALRQVHAPTLLLVGSKDTQVIEWNRRAFSFLRGEKQLEIIPGASHLFEEPGTLEKVAQLASHWFNRYLTS